MIISELRTDATSPSLLSKGRPSRMLRHLCISHLNTSTSKGLTASLDSLSCHHAHH